MPQSAGGGLVVRVDSRDLSALYATAMAAEGTIQVQLRRGIREAATPVKTAIQAAASFSTRIPAAVRIKSSFAARGASVSIVVDSSRAPEAAPINNRDHGGTFRHPVFGDKSVWATQKAVPFMQIGARSAEGACDQAMLRVMDDVAHLLGFH